ncbi:MAG: DUF4838 domain-containing protein [Actinobacteria bacterium]|nr:DUF4838 domain-containing protein [Actinomycetota bacterium]
MNRENSQHLILAQGGATNYSIIIANNATEQEQYAGEELARFLQEVTGANFPLRKENTLDNSLNQPLILLGYSNYLHNIAPDITLDGLGKEGFLIETKWPYLIIIGGRPRGTLYGTYTFLEDYVGCHWYTSVVNHIPQSPDLIIGPISERQVPHLEYREVYYYDAFDADWAVRNKCNGWGARLDTKRGRKVTYKKYLAHTFYKLIPPEKYFHEHPEYFSEIDGKRVWEVTGLKEIAKAKQYIDNNNAWEIGLAQLCLTNPNLASVVAEEAKEWLRESNEANIISISQNDSFGRCQCKNCLKLEKEEHSPAGPLIHFVNKVAELIEDEFPKINIDTLAYQYSRKPPLNVRPRHNVIVRLCTIECSFLHPLSHYKNRDFYKDLVGWLKLTNCLYIFDYVTNFGHYLQPFPNLFILAPNIRLFVENGVQGIFEEGNHNSPGGEFAELRAWLLAKLLWNPYLDTDMLIADFLKGFYGAAAPFIHEYIKLMNNKAWKAGYRIGCGLEEPIAEFLNHPGTIIQAIELFDSAEMAVQTNPEVLLRVLLARLPVDYVNIVQWASLRRVARTSGLLYPYPKESDWQALTRRFFEVIDHWSISRISEFHTIEEFRSQILK